MPFQDNESNSIQSLLALLRSTQDGTPTADPAAATHPASNVEDRSSQAPLRSLSRGNSGTVQHAQPSSAIPSTQQLNDILSSLNGSRAPSRPDVAPHQSSESAAKVSRNRMEPFGPMMNLQASPSKRKSTSQDVSAQSEHSSRTITIEKAAGATSSGISAAVDEDKSSMSFAKALPKLGEMMGDERFMSELRKMLTFRMKGEQDALERRLWAKQENIKAEHEKSCQAERDIARIARRPISAEKKALWASTLNKTLRDFHGKTCLPSLDSLFKRQRDRLESLGVPGLGGDAKDPTTVARWRKIMDLLQAGFEE